MADKEIVVDLVAAMLAVNLWTVEKVFTILEGLEREGLFDYEVIANASYEEVHAKLNAAGYQRGDYIVGLLTERLQSMGHMLCDGGLEKLRILIASADPELDQFLLSIKGIGPSVLRSFKVLRGLQP